MKYNFTDAELKEILKKIVVIVDTREKTTKHIIEWFDKKKIKYIVRKLDTADYSAMLPKGSIKGIDRDLYFTNSICIERKANIDELCGNLKEGAVRLKNEMLQLNKNGTRFFIFLEDALYHKHIRNGNYRSQYDSATLYARLKGIEAEFNTIIVPIGKEYIGAEIYNTLYYQVRNIIKRELGLKEVEEFSSIKLEVEDGQV